MINKPLDLLYSDKLSVCMICRDEEKNIISCLDQVLKFADEIIVNDTGSKDKSIELLSHYDHVRLIRSKWVQSFSIARNQAKAQATYGWVMWLDFDDRVPDSEVNKINKLKKAPLDRVLAFRVICTEEGGLPIGATLNQFRMLPNHPEINWSRRVHEQMMDCADKLGLYRIYTDAEIHHIGYEDPILKRKKQYRNLALMELDEKEYSNDINFQLSRGDAYDMIGRRDEAIEIYKKIYIPGLKEFNYDVWNILGCKIGNCYTRMNNPKEALKWFDRTEDLIEAVYHRAQCLEKLGRYDEAIDNYYKLLDMPYQVSHQGSHFDRCKMYAFQWCLRILIGRKQNEDAVKLIIKMSRDYPNIQLDDCTIN